MPFAKIIFSRATLGTRAIGSSALAYINIDYVPQPIDGVEHNISCNESNTVTNLSVIIID
jgi:hypothetical protein